MIGSKSIVVKTVRVRIRNGLMAIATIVISTIIVRRTTICVRHQTHLRKKHSNGNFTEVNNLCAKIKDMDLISIV